MAKFTFSIQSKKDPVNIYIRVRDGREVDLKAPIGKTVESYKYWSKPNGMPLQKSGTLKELYEDLTEFKSKLQAHHNKSKHKVPINIQWLRDFIENPNGKHEVSSVLVTYFDYYLKHKKAEIKPSTYSKMGSIKKLIQRFEKHSKRTFEIKDVGLDFKLQFEAYCNEQGYAPNTTARFIRFIKMVCYHGAKNNGIGVSPQLAGLRVVLEDVPKIYLSFKELTKIEKTELPHDYLDNARDWLLISSETAQRISDFMRFDSAWIRYIKRKPLIDFKQVKTGKQMAIPLSKKVVSILKKRKGEFPRKISDQRYNEYIKEVCKLAGITNKIIGNKKDPETKKNVTGEFEKWELISSHDAGRRSFATNYYGKIPTPTILYFTGHSTEAMLRLYIGLEDNEKAENALQWF